MFEAFVREHGLVLTSVPALEVPCWLCLITASHRRSLITFMPPGPTPEIGDVLYAVAKDAEASKVTPSHRSQVALWEKQVLQLEQLQDLLPDHHQELLDMVARMS